MEEGVVLSALADQLPIVPLVVAGAGLDHAHPGRGARHQGGQHHGDQGRHDRGGEVGGVSAEELRCVTGSEQSEESPVRAHHWPLQPPE